MRISRRKRKGDVEYSISVWSPTVCEICNPMRAGKYLQPEAELSRASRNDTRLRAEPPSVHFEISAVLTSTRRVGNPAHQHLRHPADSHRTFLPFPSFSLASPPLRTKETHQVSPYTVQRHALYHSNLGRCAPAESSSRIITPRPDARSPAGCGAARTQARHGWSEVELWYG